MSVLCSRGARAALAGAVASLAVAVAGPTAAHALSPSQDGGPPGGPNVPGDTTSSGCKIYKWGTMPQVVVHLDGFKQPWSPPGQPTDVTPNMEWAISDVVNEFNKMGGTTAKINGVQFTTAPHTYGTYADDSVPTIHVSFANSATFAGYTSTDTDGLTTPIGLTHAPWVYGCEMEQEDIVFLDPASHGWQFGTPFDNGMAGLGIKFSDAGTGDTAGRTWFRPSFLHELLHAFNLHHTKTQYSMLNHQGVTDDVLTHDDDDQVGGFPWANRVSSEAIRPLPYDLTMLRGRYPAGDTRYDVAALNTWFGPPGDPSDDAGWQVQSCKPSLGSGWAPDPSAGTCGVNGSSPGSTTVCQNSSLKVRYTLANYSTGSVHVQAWLYFSKDGKFHGSDPYSATSDIEDVGAAKSARVQAEFKVPHLTKGTYTPLVWLVSEHENADGSGDATSVTSDWMPLRGTVTATGSLGGCISGTRI